MRGVDESCQDSRLQLAGVMYAHIPMVKTKSGDQAQLLGKRCKAEEQKTNLTQFCVPGVEISCCLPCSCMWIDAECRLWNERAADHIGSVCCGVGWIESFT